LGGARWLVTEIMPRLRQRDPKFECLLVGDGLPDGVRQRCGDDVLALGSVADLAEIFDRVRLTVAPLRFGAGVKGKVIDSLASGVPCVMTPIGAEGLDLPAALERCIATTAEATAAAIGHLHNDKKENAACRAAGLGYIE